MAAIDVSSPKQFQLPVYDIEAVKRIASSTNLDVFYDHLLHGTLEIPASDFTYGLAPQVIKKLHEKLINGFQWEEWVKKMKAMGSHYTVITTMLLCHFSAEIVQVDVKGIEGEGDTCTIHFVHSPSSNKDAIPLILLHGWP